jgi:hypothetical protein
VYGPSGTYFFEEIQNVEKFETFVRRQRLVRELVGILASTVTLPFTYNSLKKTLGLKNAITVKEYILYLERAYLFFELLGFDFSIKKQLNSPRKIYGIDMASCMPNGFSVTPDRERIPENIVFIDMKRRGSEIFYFAKDRECDFVLKDRKNYHGRTGLLRDHGKEPGEGDTQPAGGDGRVRAEAGTDPDQRSGG